MRFFLERFIPIFFVLIYFLFTVALFFWGAVSFEVVNSFDLLLFLFLVFFMVFLGYLIGVFSKAGIENELNWRFYFRVGAFAALILFFPSIYFYTNKYPWQVFEAVGNQGDVYKNMLEALVEESLGRKVVALIRLIFSPFILSVVSLAILNWCKLTKFERVLFYFFCSSQLIFSLMRGTDKEVADFLIVAFASLLIVTYRKKVSGILRINWQALLKLFSLCVIVLCLAFSLFLDRKLSRMGGTTEFCIMETAVCANYDGPLMSLLADNLKFGSAMFTAYVAQGYYGLSLTLHDDLDSMYGFGHSIILSNAYSLITGDDEFYKRSYLYKSIAKGWDDKAVWSTIFPWIANDVGYAFVPAVMMIFAYLLARSWCSAVFSKDDSAAIVFVFLFILFMYMPANNQLAQTADTYCAFWFWIICWLFSSNLKKILRAK
ncbi:hypothetical protein [Chitinibacter tainanensis]|uniref:hypothetical protein n=1 Tax=Chitinibacter tainanensis TaxID=230667 RepID=UPI0003FC61BB|nr:hypothetical protein [Chitinibacter tainanensis]